VSSWEFSPFSFVLVLVWLLLFFIMLPWSLFYVSENLLLGATATASPTVTSSLKTYSWMPSATSRSSTSASLPSLSTSTTSSSTLPMAPRLHRAGDPLRCRLRQLEGRCLILWHYPLQPPPRPPSPASPNTLRNYFPPYNDTNSHNQPISKNHN